MALSDDEFRNNQVELMDSQTDLYRKQAFWETPKGVAAVIAATAVVVGTLAGVLGYQIGRSPPAPQFPPGTVITVPPASTGK